MKKIAVVSQKGGVGKTTTTVSLAAALAEVGWRVLVVDLDTQGSATDWLGLEAPGKGRGFLEALVSKGNLADLVVPSETPGVWGIGSGSEFVGFERVTAGDVGAEFLLRDGLDALPEQWDLVLLDCPRSVERIGVNAMVAADYALVPVHLSFPSLAPLANVVELIGLVHQRLNPDLKILGFLGCLMDYRKNHPQEVYALLRERLGDRVFEATIRDSVRFSEASAKAVPITEYEEWGIGASDYRELAEELVGRLGLVFEREQEVVNG